MPTTSEIINTIAPVSQYMAANDIERSGLNGGGTDLTLPRKLYMIRKSIEYVYNLDPTDSTLPATSKYLYALCGKYGLAAQFVTGTGGGSVAPVSPGGGSLISPIPVISANFIDATHWAGANSYNQNILSTDVLAVFFDDGQVFWEVDVQWERTSQGINVLEPGFDSTVNDYQFYIFISRP